MNTTNAASTNSQTGNKSFITAWLLSLLFGTLGVDRFYIGKVGTGIVKLLTFGGLGIWAIIDLILILTNSMRDKKGFKLSGYEDGNNKLIAIVVTIAIYVFSFSFGIATGFNGSTSSKLDEVDVNGMVVKLACN